MAERANILIVDDLPDKLLSLQTVLEELGQNIVLAPSGRDALRRLTEQDFAVILLDVNMPVRDGIAVVRALRAEPQYRHTPILMLTTDNSPDSKREGKSAGATGWIVKPFDPSQLIATVHRVLLK